MKKKRKTIKDELKVGQMESKCPMCEKIHISTAKYKYCPTCRNSKRFKNFSRTEVEVLNDYVKVSYSED